VTWNRTTLLAALPVAAVAVIAGVVSYSHIVALGLATGQSPTDAHLLPFAVDGLIVSGSVLLIYGSLLGWLCVAAGIAATIYANVMSGVGHGPLAATVAAWPAAAFALASFTLERWLKSRAKPALATDGPCGHAPAGTLDEAVVRAYVHGRDCLGDAPSQRHLAEVFNVSRPKVAALVGPLNGHAPETSALDTP
jgi:Protein of unknown function (DUF2637)